MKRLFILLTIASLCTACGWQLRGSTPVSQHLKSLYLSSQDAYSPLYQELTQLLDVHKIALVQSPTEADIQLEIMDETSDRRTAAVGADALTSAYELILSVEYDLRAPDGRPVTQLNTATVTRIFNYTAGGASSGAQEEALLLEEMRKELAQVLLLRLSATSASLAQGSR